jgi:RNA polymerase sigma-70 factor (ECF subfamily)
VVRQRDDRRDRELLGDLAAGKSNALGELFDRHAASLFRHAIVLTRRRADAEDLVQSVFVKLATTGAELLGVRQPANYLHRMLHTTWLDAHKRIATGERVVELMTTLTHVPQVDMDASMDMMRALDDLPAEQRAVIALHLVEGFSFREIGRLTGVSLFTATGRYRLALARLRKSLGRVSGGTA